MKNQIKIERMSNLNKTFTRSIHPNYSLSWFLVLVSCFLNHESFSQVSSPYSRFGLGSVRSTVFSANKAMGEVAAPYASSVNINYTNPASYASLSRTTLELGANFNGSTIHTQDSAYKASTASVNHFALAFVPNARKNSWAISMGLLPYTNANYTFIQQVNDSSLGEFSETFVGKGSLYQAYLGGAYKVKGFSAGANLGFLFGRLDYQKVILFPSYAGAYSTRNITNMNVRSFVYNVGVQYQHRIYHNTDDPNVRNDIYMTVGAYGSGGMKTRARVSSYWERFDVTSFGSVVIDTPSGNFNGAGTVTLPFNVGGGVMFGNERFWMLGADFKFANWSSYSSPLNNGSLKNSWRISFGGQITPKYDDRKYLNRVQYRLGGYAGKSVVAVAGNSLSEAGGTFGLGIPFKSVARLNFTGEFGSRWGKDKSVISETYYNIVIGFVLNDIWFVKRKFD